jgi:hypothetical protein
MVNMASSPLAVVCSLIVIVRASALGAGNATKHRNNAHQPARGKCYRCNADSPATSWPSIHRPE